MQFERWTLFLIEIKFKVTVHRLTLYVCRQKKKKKKYVNEKESSEFNNKTLQSRVIFHKYNKSARKKYKSKKVYFDSKLISQNVIFSSYEQFYLPFSVIVL
jgi:hypothetical protein